MRLLVVEVGTAAAESLTHGQRRTGHDSDNIDTESLALKTYHSADLVLLDLELPDLHGLEVCRAIRAACNTPIIAVTSRSAELDGALGLQAGSDDYLVKPYRFPELMDHVEAVMRRGRRRPHTEQTVSHGPLHIDPSIREVSLSGRSISMTRKEFDFLHLLASQPETVFTRKKIMARVWDTEWTKTSRTIDTHVSSLRKKLGASTWITTVRGVGFRLGSE